MEPVSVPTIRAVRVITAFDQRLDAMQHAFAVARDNVLAELKEDFNKPVNFIKFVVKCMQSLSQIDFVELHSFERDDMTVDLVQEVISSMSISEKEKQFLRENGIPMVHDIMSVLRASSKGYLYLKHKVDDAVAAAGCKKKPVASRRLRDVSADPAVPSVPSVPVDVNALVSDVYNTLETMLRVKQVTMANLISIGSTVMQIVEQYPQLPGDKKKVVALGVLHKVVASLSVSDENKALMDSIIDTTVSHAIDFIVMASRGEIAFVKELEAQIKGCVAACQKKRK